MKNKVTKVIVAKTVMFLAATAFIVLFKSVFGEANVFVGIGSFIAMLMLMERDLTGNLLKYTSIFLFVNLLTGIGIFIIGKNMWLGIPVNFLIVFIIGYFFCNDLRKPIYLPFMLQYIFLLSEPHVESESKRILALIIGALLIMLPQILFNMKKLKKQSIKTFSKASDLIVEKVKLIEQEKEINKVNEEIEELFKGLKIAILDRKDKDCNLSKEGEKNLTMLVCLQKLNSKIREEDNISEEVLSYIKIGMELFKKVVNNEINYEEFTINIHNLNEKYKEELGKTVTSVQILNSFKVIGNTMQIIETNDESFEIKKNKKKFSIGNFIKENKDGVGFCYGIRAGIGIAVTYFIAQFFHLQEGYWMAVTIYSVVNPIYEISKYKMKDRVISTILGGITVVILFSIFKGSMERSIIMLLTGYIMTYFTQYKYTIYFVTINIVAMATGSGSITSFAAQRIMFVAIGVIIAIFLNKFVLKKSLEDINNNLIERYRRITRDMIESIYNMAKSKKIDKEKIEEDFLTTSLIENKIKENFEVSLIKQDLEIELRKRILVVDIFSLYIELGENINSDEYRVFFEKQIERLAKNDGCTLEKCNVLIEKSTTIQEKIIYANIYEIKRNLDI
ncbi:MAG: FUSC family protein [Clostridium sp.]|uniref:FUSC family protein n=1 Tax=Clostridium sp. TaxID=1506 RepID=UPI003F40F866